MATALKYIDLTQSCDILNCTTDDVIALINTTPRIVRARGKGNALKICRNDLIDWKKKKKRFQNPAIGSTKKHGPTAAPETITTSLDVFYSIGSLARDLKRSFGTLTNWINKAPHLKTYDLPDPAVIGSPARKYVNSKGYAHILELIDTRPPGRGQTKQKVQDIKRTPDGLFYSIGYACKMCKRTDTTIVLWIEKNKNFRIYLLPDDNAIKGKTARYVSAPCLNWLKEESERRLRLAIPKKPLHKTDDETYDSDEYKTCGQAGKLIGHNDAKIRHQIDKNGLPSYGSHPKKVKMSEVYNWFDLPDPNAAAQPARDTNEAPAALAESEPEPEPTPTPAQATPSAPAAPSTIDDKTLLLKALELGDATIATRVLDLLERLDP